MFLSRDNTAISIVDIQGRLAELMQEKESLFANLRKLVKAARVLGLPIIWTEQLPNKLGPTITVLSELMEGLQPIVKSSFSCCGSAEFMKQVSATGRRQILLAGIETHVCVYQTAIDLLQRGYEVQVVADAVSSRTAENRAVGLERIKQAGARLTTTEMALFELVGKPEAPEFPEIIRIIR